MAAKAAQAEIQDEYTLKPDELTKEMFAAKAGVEIRTVELWKAGGKIASEKVRRRNNGTVRKTTIFKLDNVQKFLDDQNKAANMYQIEKPGAREEVFMQLANKTEHNSQGFSQMFANNNQEEIGRMIHAQLIKAEAEAKKAVYEGNLTFSLEEAAQMFDLSIVHLKAEAKTFRGKNQKLMITKKNLEAYLENL